MQRNSLLYNAANALITCAKYVKPIDNDYAQVLLDKAQEYTNQILIDNDLEKEVDEFEGKIREGIKES